MHPINNQYQQKMFAIQLIKGEQGPPGLPGSAVSFLDHFFIGK